MEEEGRHQKGGLWLSRRKRPTDTGQEQANCKLSRAQITAHLSLDRLNQPAFQQFSQRIQILLGSQDTGERNSSTGISSFIHSPIT